MIINKSKPNKKESGKNLNIFKEYSNIAKIFNYNEKDIKNDNLAITERKKCNLKIRKNVFNRCSSMKKLKENNSYNISKDMNKKKKKYVLKNYLNKGDFFFDNF